MTIRNCSACGGETWVNAADTPRWFCDCGAEQSAPTTAAPAAPLVQRRPQRSTVRHGQASCADYGCTRTECRQAARRARRQRNQAVEGTSAAEPGEAC